MEIIASSPNTSAILPAQNNIILNFGLATDLGSLAQFIVCRTILNVSDELTNNMLRNYINSIIPEFNEMQNTFKCDNKQILFQITILEKRLIPIIEKAFITDDNNILLKRIENSIKRVTTFKNNSIDYECVQNQLVALEGFIAFYERF